MGLKLVTAPSSAVLSLDEMKNYLRLETSFTADDSLLSSLIKAGTLKIEQFIHSGLISQTWDLWLDAIPTVNKKNDWWDGTRQGSIVTYFSLSDSISLRMGNIRSVVSFTSYDLDNNATVFASTNYIVDDKNLEGRLVLNNGSVWPVNLRSRNAVQIRFKTGFGTDKSQVPDDIKNALKLIVGHFYENRGCDTGTIPEVANCLISPYQIKEI